MNINKERRKIQKIKGRKKEIERARRGERLFFDIVREKTDTEKERESERRKERERERERSSARDSSRSTAQQFRNPVKPCQNNNHEGSLEVFTYMTGVLHWLLTHEVRLRFPDTSKAEDSIGFSGNNEVCLLLIVSPRGGLPEWSWASG